ncbi:Protein TolB [bacterium HR17]|uniref:Protein TolB n=1 Tax=Candidatus Fervidibacter japonicus TaxID=2035412 RepID=A0A2H5XE51_9BACT|nr:Protein TolB [bacterium HR17]
MRLKGTTVWQSYGLMGLAGLFVFLLAALAPAPPSPPSQPPRPLFDPAAMQRWLRDRDRFGPGLERRLRAEWQQRALKSRQARQQEISLTAAPGQELYPAWSPDGRTIAFSTNSVDSNGNKRLDQNDGTGTRLRIWLMNPDGSNARPAIPEGDIPSGVPKGDELYPAWFPDSATLALVISAGGTTDIYTVNLRTSPVQIQRRTFGLQGVRRIAVAPSGAEIAFEQNNQIFLLALDTGAIRQLTTQGVNRNPAYLPDGRILFESNLDPNTGQPGAFFHIWVMRGDGQNPRPITSGNQNDTDPAPVYYTNPNSNLGQRGFRVAFTSDRNGNRDVFLTNEDGSQVRQVSPAGNQTQEFQPTVEPFPAVPGTIERIAFVTTRAGSEDIWVISSIDIFPPLLADQFGNPILPQITPKINLPGDTVTLTAAAFDPESGVDKVYAVFKSADNPLFLWAVHNEGFPDSAGQQNPGDQAAIAHEADWMIVNFDPDTGQERNPPLVNTLELMFQAGQGNSVQAFWQQIQPYAIELFDDGTHGDQQAGDGIYTRRIKLPPTPRDYYVTIIPVDRAGNIPASLTFIALGTDDMVMPQPSDPRSPDVQIITTQQGRILQPNRSLSAVPAIGYDNITGCTSKPFAADKDVLLVSDYACGQKWTTQRAAGLGNFERFLNYPGIPTETYYFSDVQPPPLIVPYNLQKGVISRNTQHCPFPNVDLVAIWRTLCRGPVPEEILALYLPRPFVDPVLNTTRLHAERAVVWLAPYTGSLWVDKGTLEDPVTQGKLARFLSRSGRLFIASGQDLGWALTLNGQTNNDFLTTYLKARFSRVVGGFYGDYSLDLISSYQAQRHKLQGQLVASGFYDWGQGFTFNEDRLTADNQNRDPDQERHGTAAGIELLGFNYRPDTTYDPPINPSQYNPSWGFMGEGCENALVMDTVDVLQGAFATYTYLQGGTNAAVQYRDPATDYRVVTFFFPMEAMNNGFKNTTIGQTTFVEPLTFRHTLMNYIMDFLRTGVIAGKVVDTQGRPLAGFTVRAQINSLQQQPIVFGGAITQQDGSYQIIGLNTGVYDLEVAAPGWTSRLLRTTSEGVNDFDNVSSFVSAGNDFTMTKLPPGAISGKVTELDGTTPIVGATVTARIVADEQGNPIVLPPGIPSTYTATTGSDGTYRIEGLPNATYEVTASAPQHSSVTKTGIVVRPGQETTGVDFQLPGSPGTITGQVVDSQTNQGVPNALVEVLSGNTVVKTATTDSQGNFTVTDVPVGTYTVQASASNYKPNSVTGVQVPTAGTVTVTIALARAQPGSISGRVTRADGTPIGGVTVEVVQPATGQVIASATTASSFTTQDGYQRNYLIASVPLGTYTVRVNAPGYTASPSQRTGVTVQENTETRDINFTLRAQFTFTPGVQMVSLPYDYTGTGITPPQLFGTTQIATWVTDPSLTDPTTGASGGQYVFYPTAPADVVRLGRGYFVRFTQSVDFTTPGNPAPTDQPFALVLDKKGWWLIGAPFPFSVDWQRTRVINRANGQNLSLRDAVLQGLLRDALFTLNASGTGYDLSATLDPFRGYWVRVEASQGVILQIDNAPVVNRMALLVTNAGRPSRMAREGRLALSDKDGWLLPLTLRNADGVIATLQIGMNRAASDGPDALDVPLPPPLRQLVPAWTTFAIVSGTGRGEGLWASDIRSLSARPQAWDILVEGQSNAPLTLTWDNLNDLVPNDYRLTLVDLETGDARYMRTTTSYTVELRGGVRRLRVIAERRTGAAGLRIVGLRQQPSRGGALAVQFALTEPAFLEGRLLTLTGRVVQVVQPRRWFPSGDHRLRWDGRGRADNLLPQMPYLLELTAIGERGEQVRATLLVRWR